MKAIGAAGVLVFATGAAHGQLWVLEDFEAGSNGAGWTFGVPNEVVATSGGYYSSSYIRATELLTRTPWFGTGAGSSTPFTGNFRAAGVTRVAAALIVRHSDLPVATQIPAALLISFNGTPADPSDDWGAFTLTTTGLGGPGIWYLHSFNIPAAQTSLPASWAILPLGANAPANPNWNTLMQGVDRLVIAFGDPSASPPVQNWDVGADYMLVTDRPGCFANCDGSTDAHYLNVLDFICFLNRYAAGDLRANCDMSTLEPRLNVLDFSCYLMMFAAGCTGP